MPFMGRDWRSPGEAWVKTESLGWQRMKIIESQLYLAACPAGAAACSWPPESAAGQHMAEHCESRPAGMDCDRPDGETRAAGPCRSRAAGSVDDESASSSSGRSSASSSPADSPEKGAGGGPRHHHHRPITISSPYGRYSAAPCCGRHFHPAANGRAEDAPDEAPPGGLPRQLLSPWLDGQLSGGAGDKGHRSLRHNRSAPSFTDPAGLRTGRSQPASPRLETEVRQAADRSSLRPHSAHDNGRPASAAAAADCCHCRAGDPSGQPRPDAITSGPAPGEPAKLHQPAVSAPHCRISVRTREVAMHNTISEAFYRLDFYNAIHDIRRFNYICKLLHLLITQNLTSLSGCATRVLFTMLEQVAWEVAANKRNINVIRNLLAELRLTIQKYYCWGRPIGSSLLWQQHFETIERISQIVDEIELSPPKSDACQMTFERLPVEMIREILLRLTDYRDLVSSAQASPVLRTMIDNQCIWRRMCRYHFSDQQLKLAFAANKFGFVKKPDGAQLRGIKYARTTSADGRRSYRSPVGRPSGAPQLSSDGATAEATPASRPPGRGERDEPRRRPSPAPPVSAAARPALEIDWERVFHQLRKRFDLKEEYADCLLLCRHCRCLFWKSFGHPCIKSEDPARGRPGSADAENNNYDCDTCRPAGARRSAPPGAAAGMDSPRISVALLSRNFDRQAFEAGEPDLPAGPQFVGDASGASSRSQGRPSRSTVRQPLGELDAQLREHNVNRARRQDWHEQPTRQDAGRDSGRRRDAPRELVPKHVTISPQAFLKFFSL